MPTQGKALRTTVPSEEARRRVIAYATLNYGGVSEMIRELVEREMHAHEKLHPGQESIDLSMTPRGGYRERGKEVRETA